jgi:integrase
MGLYRRGDSRSKNRVWWISYMKDGRQHRESTGSRNKSVANRVLAVRLGQVVEGRWSLPSSNSPRLGQFAKEFLKTITHENTRDRYQQSVRNLLRHFGERVRLAEITPESIYSFQQQRLAEGVGKATINRDTSTLSSCMTKARKMRLISRNPCADVEKLNERRDRRRAKPLSYDEEASLIRCAPMWLSTLVTFLIETGLRVKKEALGLKWDDVLLDSEPACVHVRESKSEAGLRPVWLTDHCKDTLLKWRQVMDLGASPYVFPSPRNPKCPIFDYKTAWRVAAKKAGLGDRRVHDLRATFASRANMCKASGLTLAQLLGHNSTQILPTYVKPIDENTKSVMQALDAARHSHNAVPRTIQ